MKPLLILVLSSTFLVTGPFANGYDLLGRIDKSNTIFLTSKLQDQIGDYQSFPVFWWNFLVRDIGDEDWAGAEEACQALKSLSPEFVLRAQCQESPKDYLPLVRDWSGHFPLRSTMPPVFKFSEKFNLALSQASLPMVDTSLLEILRLDPFETWRDLKAKADTRVNIKLSRKNGFFFDPKTHRVVIPVQMGYPPSETLKTALFQKSFKYWGDWLFLGPHGSYLQNEDQIIKDVSKVSTIGLFLLVCFTVALFYFKRLVVLLLLPPVLVAMLISTVITIAVFGSIHGLTLSFGTAIVGLALDYGLQAAFNGRSPHLWRSNFFGLATTVCGLLILMTSSMPLLRQMMFFSSFGLLAAFAMFYYLFRRWPQIFNLKPLREQPGISKIKTTVAVILILCSLVSFLVLRPTLDMSRFDFQDPRSRSNFKWLFQTIERQPPLFSISKDGLHLETAWSEKNWADGRKIELENIAEYLPPASLQSQNIKTWVHSTCEAIEGHLDKSSRNFFIPFFKSKPCEASVLDSQGLNTLEPSYVSHLKSKMRWLTLWLPENEQQEMIIRKQYPQVVALKEVVAEIPLTLSRELKWLAPLSLLLTGCILFLYYKNLIRTLSALIPFFSGMGLVSLCAWFIGFDISFVSVIGLTMVFGFSIDYGIFATDVNRGLEGQSAQGVWTGLTMAALTTASGFAPLLFCKHPVLLGLGQTLFFGTLGTYIGATWGIPGLTHFYVNFKKS